MDGYYVKKIGKNKGAPRLWFEGTQTSRAGFKPGQRYDVIVEGLSIVLQANPDGSRVVSGKTTGESNNPIIDLNSTALLAIFDGMAAVKVIVKEGEIHLLPLATELKKRERFTRLKQKLENGDPLEIGSLSHGTGILSHAIHSGLHQAGIKTRLAFANEIREELLEHAAIHNDAWDEKTTVLAAPMQELAFDEKGLADIPKCEGIEIALPCSGHSKAGKSKRHLINSEAHPEVGYLVVAALVIINRVNPAFISFENVPGYSASASADILRGQLREMGYVTHEKLLNGKVWGALENRDRWCMVAVTEGVQFDFDQLIPPEHARKTLGDILDKTIDDDDARWRTFDYLKEKEVRDIEKGNGFRMAIMTESDESIPTLRKGYSKAGSTDPLIRNESNPALLRQLTPQEHAAAKGIPTSLVDGLSNTIAHQALGQSIIYEPFKEVGKLIGHSIQSSVNKIAELAQLAGVTASEANANGRYSGQIVAMEGNQVVQDVGKGKGVIHDVGSLDKRPSIGAIVKVEYREGKGLATQKSSNQLSLEL